MDELAIIIINIYFFLIFLNNKSFNIIYYIKHNTTSETNKL